MNDLTQNLDPDVAAGFGHEWSVFRQSESELSAADRQAIFESYFHIFPWDALPPDAVGMDIGCGTGRWAMMVAPRVGHLHLLDASKDALAVARDNLARTGNVSFHLASVGSIPLEDNSLDFAYSLGVLHHVPDTSAALWAVASKLKSGAPLLVYLYYALDNRPGWYRTIWRFSNAFRMVISRQPPWLRLVISRVIAIAIYLPLARFAAIVEKLGFSPSALPLESYRHRALYVMRTDAYDRFCTKLEQRFTRQQIAQMLSDTGFENIRFSEEVPYWCAVGIKK
jgi:SAM-dependent methyltransferase